MWTRVGVDSGLGRPIRATGACAAGHRTGVLLVPCSAAASRRREGQGRAQGDGCRLMTPEPMHALSSWEDLIPPFLTPSPSGRGLPSFWSRMAWPEVPEP